MGRVRLLLPSEGFGFQSGPSAALFFMVMALCVPGPPARAEWNASALVPSYSPPQQMGSYENDNLGILDSALIIAEDIPQKRNVG